MKPKLHNWIAQYREDNAGSLPPNHKLVTAGYTSFLLNHGHPLTDILLEWLLENLEYEDYFVIPFLAYKSVIFDDERHMVTLKLANGEALGKDPVPGL
jgi:hypothetical protein